MKLTKQEKAIINTVINGLVEALLDDQTIKDTKSGFKVTMPEKSLKKLRRLLDEGNDLAASDPKPTRSNSNPLRSELFTIIEPAIFNHSDTHYLDRTLDQLEALIQTKEIEALKQVFGIEEGKSNE